MTRAQDLLARWEEDALSEAEQQELITLLENDPQARRLLVREWSLSSALARLLNGRASPGEPGWKHHTARHLAARRRNVTRRAPVRWWSVAAAAALLVAIGGWWSSSGPAPVATVVLSQGAAPAVGTTLPAGATVTVSAGARVRLRLASGSEVTLSDLADLLITTPDHLTLTRGHAELEIAPRLSGAPPFVVSTPHGDTRVLGTSFRLEVDREETVVLVSHGQVQVERRDGASVAASAGQRAVLRADRYPVSLPVWVADQREVLLITGTTELDAGERRLLGLLSGLGLRPRVVLAGQVEDREVGQARLAVLCNRIALPDLEKRLRHPQCPLVILEQGAWPLYGFPIAKDQTITLEQAVVADIVRSHPLTAGLSAPLTLAGPGSRINRGLSGTSTLLTLSDGGQTLLAVHEPGERLPDGTISPQRRVAFFATTDALPQLTPAGEQLLGAALRWAAELGGP